MKMVYGPRNSTLAFVVKNAYDNVVEVDLALISMVRAVDKWYDEYYQNDANFTEKSIHKAYLVRFYDSNRFSNYETIGEERLRYLEEIDLYTQTKKDD